MKIPQVMDGVYALYINAKGNKKRIKILEELKKRLKKNGSTQRV